MTRKGIPRLGHGCNHDGGWVRAKVERYGDHRADIANSFSVPDTGDIVTQSESDIAKRHAHSAYDIAKRYAHSASSASALV